MDFLNLHKKTNVPVSTGKLLIAEPFLSDPSFARSVILLCEHGVEGSVGFVLNRRTSYTLEDILPEMLGYSLPIYQGGPVQLDTLHMLHAAPEVFGGVEVAKNIYWGGSYNSLADIPVSESHSTEVRLMLGYAGWSPGQLEKELEENTWLVTEPDRNLLFNTNVESIWKKAVQSLGPGYEYLTLLPMNPQLN